MDRAEASGGQIGTEKGQVWQHCPSNLSPLQVLYVFMSPCGFVPEKSLIYPQGQKPPWVEEYAILAHGITATE